MLKRLTGSKRIRWSLRQWCTFSVLLFGAFNLTSGCSVQAEPDPLRASSQSVVQRSDSTLLSDDQARDPESWLSTDMPVIDNPVSRLQLEEWFTRIDQAQLDHPAVESAMFSEEQAISVIGEAQALLRPRVSIGASANSSRSYRDGVRVPTMSGMDTSSAARLDPNIVVNYTLYDGGAARARIDEATSSALSARNSRRSVEGGVGLRAADTLIDLARVQEQLIVARENLKAVELIREMVRGRVDAGRDAPSEMLQMNGRLLEARRQVADLVGQRAEAGARHSEIFGEPPVILAFPKVFAPIPTSYDSSLAIAMRKNPDILASRESLSAAVSRDEALRADGLPRVEVEARVDYFDVTRSRNDNYDASIGLYVTYDLYDGGLRRARQRGSRSQVREAEAANQQVTRDVELALASAYANREGLIPELRIIQGQLDHVTATRDAYQEQFIAGRRDLNELISAQQQVFGVSLQVSEFKAELHRQHFTILSLLGELGSSRKPACLPTETIECRGNALGMD